MCSKSIEPEAVFTKIEMNNNWSISFFQNSLLGIEHAYTREFSIGRCFLDVLWSTIVVFIQMSCRSSSPIFEMNFSAYKKKKTYRSKTGDNY